MIVVITKKCIGLPLSPSRHHSHVGSKGILAIPTKISNDEGYKKKPTIPQAVRGLLPAINKLSKPPNFEGLYCEINYKGLTTRMFMYWPDCRSFNNATH